MFPSLLSPALAVQAPQPPSTVCRCDRKIAKVCNRHLGAVGCSDDSFGNWAATDAILVRDVAIEVSI